MRPSRLVILVPALWLALFFLAPFFLVAKISLSEVATAIPPYQPTFSLGEPAAQTLEKLGRLSFANYATIAGDSLYVDAFLTAVRIAATGAVILLLVGYPIAHAIARAPARWRPLLVAAVILPFWTSFLIRAYAWIGILKPEGLLNGLLLWIGLIREPVMFLNTEAAILIAVVYCYLPFMVLPLYASLEKIAPTLKEAAADLGASPWVVFFRVTLPLSLPGALAGAVLCFVPIVGEVVIPDLLGGADTLMVGKTLWTEFFNNRDWPVASAVAIVLIALLLAPILWFQRLQGREARS